MTGPQPRASAGNQASGQVTGAVVQAGTVSGGIHVHGQRPQWAVPLPRQLPAAPSWLAGRAEELGVLDGLLADGQPRGPVLAVLSGPPGIGKTALALWWLHAHSGQFSAGCLHADLDLSHGGGELPADVLGRWLRALGVPAEWIPAGEAELTGLWRSVTAGKRLAVLAENAGTTAAVRTLLPGGGGPVLLVTSRTHLPALSSHGARYLRLGPLPPDAAAGLLGQIAGEGRVAAEPDAALRLARACGGIPLAVCAAAGQLVISQERIADAAASWNPLDDADEEAGMRSALDAAYAALDPGTARAYRLLGLHPGPGFTAGLAAAALGISPEQARTSVSRLVSACLAEPAGPGRYRFHDLISAHARDLAGREETSEDRRAVLARITGWYLANCAEAERLLQPYRHGLRRDAAPPPPAGPDVTAGTALDWLDAERHSLRAVVDAAVSVFPDAAWQLADATWPLWLYRGHPRGQLQVSRAGLDAARRCCDLDGQARMLDRIGIAHLQLSSPHEASVTFTQAGDLWRSIGNAGKAAGTARKLGWAAASQGQHDTAAGLYRRALAGYQQPGTGSSRQAGLTMIDLGAALTAAGQAGEAAAVLGEAARLLAAQPDPDPYNSARAQAALGRAQASPAQGLPLLHQALDVFTSLGVIPERASVLETLAELTAHAGDPRTARARYREALAILPAGHPRTHVIRHAIAALPGPDRT